MVHLKSCWSPCYWHGSVYSGSKAVAGYTLAMSICIVTYCVYVITGGDSSQLWLPFFESNLDTDARGACGFVIFYFCLHVVFSALLIFGILTEIRGFFLPWTVSMWIVVVFQATFSTWLLFGYYIYLEVVFAAVCNWIWMTFNGYCIFVVQSHYRNVKLLQSPDIEYLSPY